SLHCIAHTRHAQRIGAARNECNECDKFPQPPIRQGDNSLHEKFSSSRNELQRIWSRTQPKLTQPKLKALIRRGPPWSEKLKALIRSGGVGAPNENRLHCIDTMKQASKSDYNREVRQLPNIRMEACNVAAQTLVYRHRLALEADDHLHSQRNRPADQYRHDSQRLGESAAMAAGDQAPVRGVLRGLDRLRLPVRSAAEDSG